jgi:hypothetical protein
VRIEIADPVLAEGGQTNVRIWREWSGGECRVALASVGDAVLGRDFTVAGHDQQDESGLEVTLPRGSTVVELVLEVTDDVPAEADERIVLNLRESTEYEIDETAASAAAVISHNDFAVTSTKDEGEGSLRQAIVNAVLNGEPTTINFDSTSGPFAEPRTILLETDLPPLTGELTIDGYIEGQLWKATGVTVSGNQARPVFHVPAGSKVKIESLTVADGSAVSGGGIANEGELVIKSVTFLRNRASKHGGGLINLGGRLEVINSTFVENRAGKRGGGLANLSGSATVTNCTFAGNESRRGAGLFSRGELLLRNTILADNEGDANCRATGGLDPASTHNLIESNDGCGTPIAVDDPRFEQLGYYNGPTQTLPPGGGSPAINLGDNASAVDEDGNPLVWDQRGNGDPRFVAGFTDIGAFERQRSPLLVVDTEEDRPLRGCSIVAGDCSLRGALEIANAVAKPAVITFDPRVFDVPRTITLTRPLEQVTTDLILDASETAGVTIKGTGDAPVFRLAPDVELDTEGIFVEPPAESIRKVD